MKHLPNILTLGNLFCGCIAITYILGAQNFNTAFDINTYVEVPAVEQPYIASIFIFLAAVFDMLDGAVARALKIHSPIGKDLDSLADVVSFGVAPSMILFKMLWAAYMTQPDAMDVSLFLMSPALLVACFAALRLAIFNQSSSEQKNFFMGMPTPAVGLFVATFPLMVWQNPMLGYFYKPWLLYAVIALLCWLMVSKMRFFKLLPESWNMKNLLPRILLLAGGIVAIPFLGWAASLVFMGLYIVLSVVFKPQQS
ncbi:MAG TPA: CDP-alcohol phosphatidyltransferase family protein [Flavipsychrobacter sp.]|nr:CDP-alcohol phosphatidyltransferase family protein [Flavipsychrobacter sp.]